MLGYIERHSSYIVVSFRIGDTPNEYLPVLFFFFPFLSFSPSFLRTRYVLLTGIRLLSNMITFLSIHPILYVSTRHRALIQNHLARVDTRGCPARTTRRRRSHPSSHLSASWPTTRTRNHRSGRASRSRGSRPSVRTRPPKPVRARHRTVPMTQTRKGPGRQETPPSSAQSHVSGLSPQRRARESAGDRRR